MLFSKKNNTIIMAVFLSAVLILMAGCAGEDTDNTGQTIGAGAETSHELAFEYTDEDMRTVPVSDSAEYDLDSLDDDLVITEGGDYRLTGSMDHRIVIDTDDQPVHLYMSDVSLSPAEGGALLVLSAGKVVLTCMDGTENRFHDSPYYGKYRDYDACVYSVPDLTVNGPGRLVIGSVYEDAIHVKDIFKAVDTSIDIRAKGDGIRGNDGVSLVNVTGRIESEKNGIRTTKNGKDIKGCIVIRNTGVSIIAGKYAINSYDSLDIRDSEVFMKGILGDTLVSVDTYIQEGNAVNE